MNETKQLERISKYNIKISNQKQILQYISNYGLYRLIECYGLYLVKILDKKTTSSDIINVFEFDRKFAGLIGNYIFDFEQRLNTIAIAEIFKHNHLEDNYILTITNNPAYSNLKNKGFGDFVNEIYDNAKSCNLISDFSDPKKIPLKILSVSWSLHTLISFIQLQDTMIINNITKQFNITQNSEYFISVCHSIRKFRNILSHNGLFFASRLNYYRREFNIFLNHNLNHQYDIETDINISKLIILLEQILNKDIKNTIYKLFKEFKITKKVRKSLLKDMGFFD